MGRFKQIQKRAHFTGTEIVETLLDGSKVTCKLYEPMGGTAYFRFYLIPSGSERRLPLSTEKAKQLLNQ